MHAVIPGANISITKEMVSPADSGDHQKEEEQATL
jgi:hypothetical protein